MTGSDLCGLSITELHSGYRDARFSPVDVVSAARGRIESLNPSLNAFVEVNFERAEQEAAEAERAVERDEWRPLLGVPVAIKDLIDTADMPTRYGSRMYKGHTPKTDARVVARLKAAGAIVLGKTATHEFAWGFTTDNPHFGPTRNPWDSERIPGGSSGGNGVALATGMVSAAVGTDTGGSVRVPAAFCGVCGLKPSYGRLPMDGIFPLAPSLDHVGPMARHPADLRILLAAMGQQPVGKARASVRGLRVGITQLLHQPEPARANERAFRGVCDVLSDAGAVLIELDAPQFPVADVFTTLMLRESLETHRNANLYPGRSNEYGDDVLTRLRMAEDVSDADFERAQQARERLLNIVQQMFREVDVLVSLCAGDSPPRIESLFPSTDENRREYDTRRIVLGYTALQNLTGMPSSAVRAGFDDKNLPIAVQFTGPRGTEETVLDIAEWLFDASPGVQSAEPGTANQT